MDFAINSWSTGGRKKATLGKKKRRKGGGGERGKLGKPETPVRERARRR